MGGIRLLNQTIEEEEERYRLIALVTKAMLKAEGRGGKEYILEQSGKTGSLRVLQGLDPELSKLLQYFSQARVQSSYLGHSPIFPRPSLSAGCQVADIGQ